MNPLNPTGRFSSRAEDYARYRPGYPAAALDFLRAELNLTPGQTVADIGAGTGIFSRLLAERQLRVFAIEPNEAMRSMAERHLNDCPGVTLSAGTGEATGLSAGAVGAVFCAQAFHWCEPVAARAEWLRILQPQGAAVLIWNKVNETRPFEKAYNDVIAQFGDGVRQPFAMFDERSRHEVLYGQTPATRIFEHEQIFDREGLMGRTRSLSHLPLPGQARHDELFAEVNRLFEQHQHNGTVTLHYDTHVFFGRLK